MNDFVRIQTVFSSEDNRTVPHLAGIYSCPDELEQIFTGITGDCLNNEMLAGKSVLIKPNWVTHSARQPDELCLRTHDRFVLAFLEFVLRCKPSEVIIGDAPIQGCHWDQMINGFFLNSVTRLSSIYSVKVKIKDFRRVTFDPALNNPKRELHPASDYLIFDLGKSSYLEDVSRTGKNNFRITHYNPDRLANAHKPGVHKYCITKELVSADVVISLPKIKTHQKAGVTGALKNLVGLNGDKDFLPHHRLGGTGFGGDCYPGKNYLRYLAEHLLDSANRKQGTWQYRPLMKLSGLCWHLTFPGKVHNTGANWYGNDTTWRMVLDLNRIAIYGTSDGKISDIPQRVLFSLCDGIIGGQGDGPLRPDPLPLGIVGFSNNAFLNDLCMAILMDFEPSLIPLLKEAYLRYSREPASITINGAKTTLHELRNHSVKTVPPAGWKELLGK